MHAQVFQHVPFEGPGSIESWLHQHGATLAITRLFNEETPPPVESVDLLIVMGGPMSVTDECSYPWLKAEKSYIRTAVDAGIPILGICLGAQLIAAAKGAKVYANPAKEIGWFPILGSSQEDAFRFPEEMTVFHWHGETFDLPSNAIRLASSPVCKNQAFQLRNQKVIGLQFHLESTPESLTSIIENCREELVEAPKIMSEREMKALAPQHFREINRQMDRLLDFLVD
jgi:GMP synthase-like glutamine amidotransferase